MTDQVEATAEAEGNSQDGNAGTVVEGQPTGPELFAELDTETRDWVQKRHEGDVNKLAKQAYELDKFAGSAVQVPKDDAEADVWDKFYTKLGRPEASDKYEFQVPKDLPETMPYNEELAKSFKDQAFEMGLSAKQAAKAHDWFVSQQVASANGFETQTADSLKADITTANETIQGKWGKPDSETYKANLDLAGKFFNAVDDDGGLREKLAGKGLVGPSGEILVPELAFAFSKAGAAIFAEGSTLSEGGGIGGANPFDGDVNLTKVMALAKADPDKARLMAKAAGVNPKDYGL